MDQMPDGTLSCEDIQVIRWIVDFVPCLRIDQEEIFHIHAICVELIQFARFFYHVVFLVASVHLSILRSH